MDSARATWLTMMTSPSSTSGYVRSDVGNVEVRHRLPFLWSSMLCCLHGWLRLDLGSCFVADRCTYRRYRLCAGVLCLFQGSFHLVARERWDEACKATKICRDRMEAYLSKTKSDRLGPRWCPVTKLDVREWKDHRTSEVPGMPSRTVIFRVWRSSPCWNSSCLGRPIRFQVLPGQGTRRGA